MQNPPQTMKLRSVRTGKVTTVMTHEDQDNADQAIVVRHPYESRASGGDKALLYHCLARDWLSEYGRRPSRWPFG